MRRAGLNLLEKVIKSHVLGGFEKLKQGLKNVCEHFDDTNHSHGENQSRNYSLYRTTLNIEFETYGWTILKHNLTLAEA